MQKELLELMEIKNIGLISIYKVNYNDDNDNNIGIKIVYDKDKVLDYNYKYKFFNDYLIRIRQVYKRENSKAIIIGDSSDELLNSFNIDVLSDFNSCNQKLIFPFNRFNGNVNLIKYAIKNILNCLNKDENIEIISISNFNQNYHIEYKVKDKQFFVNFVLTMNDIDEVRFTISFFQNFALKTEGIISKKDNGVFINWHSLDNKLVGKINALADKNYKEEILKFNGITVDIKEIDTNVNSKDINVINRYLSSLNLDLVDNGILLCDDTYLLFNIKNINDEQIRKVSYYVTFNDDYIYILQTDVLGMMINTTFYPTNTKKIEYILKKTKENEYIVCEKILNINDNYFNYNNCKYSLINTLKEKQNIEISMVKKKIKE